MKSNAVYATSVVWLLGLSLLDAGAGHAAVIWKGDFETGDLKQWMGGVNQMRGGRVNAEVVMSPVQQGTSAGKLTIHADDTFGGGQMRVQINRASPRTGEGQDLFMSFWFMMTTAPGIRDNINYFESNGSNQNMMTWWVAPKAGGGNTVNYGTGSLGRTQQWTADFTLNQWHQLAWQIHWSVNAATGSVKLWYDGAVVVDVKVKTKADGNSMNMQTGFHRAGQSAFVDTIYLDNYIEGETLEDIQITTTGASDGGVPADDGGRGDSGASADAGASGSGGVSGGGNGGDGSGGNGSGGVPGSGGNPVMVGASGSGGNGTPGTGGPGVVSGGCAVAPGGPNQSLAVLAIALLAVAMARGRRISSDLTLLRGQRRRG
ncbi:MAG TPA: heparin lyase I family protein [Polyangia bacterium]|jgi:hypothetical protein|nr:heparin lyase I family protein [Polyangia bacterium]